MPECCDAMLAYAYGAAPPGSQPRAEPLGVKELLSRLAERDDVIVALATGNKRIRVDQDESPRRGVRSPNPA